MSNLSKEEFDNTMELIVRMHGENIAKYVRKSMQSVREKNELTKLGKDGNQKIDAECRGIVVDLLCVAFAAVKEKSLYSQIKNIHFNEEWPINFMKQMNRKNKFPVRLVRSEAFYEILNNLDSKQSKS